MALNFLGVALTIVASKVGFSYLVYLQRSST